MRRQHRHRLVVVLRRQLEPGDLDDLLVVARRHASAACARWYVTLGPSLVRPLLAHAVACGSRRRISLARLHQLAGLLEGGGVVEDLPAGPCRASSLLYDRVSPAAARPSSSLTCCPCGLLRSAERASAGRAIGHGAGIGRRHRRHGCRGRRRTTSSIVQLGRGGVEHRLGGGQRSASRRSSPRRSAATDGRQVLDLHRVLVRCRPAACTAAARRRRPPGSSAAPCPAAPLVLVHDDDGVALGLAGAGRQLAQLALQNSICSLLACICCCSLTISWPSRPAAP